MTAPAAQANATRWWILVLTSLALFGNYYVYDSIAPVADLLQRQLGFSDTQLGTLNAIYSLPNIFLVLVGGVLVDRYGAALVTLCTTVICLVGATLTAIGGSFETMALGRLLFGIGAETMIVAGLAAIGQWFAGSMLAFAMGLSVSVARAGSYSADISPTFAKPLYEQGWQEPLWLATGIAALSLIGGLGYWMLDRSRRRRADLPRTQAAQRIAWSDLWRFDRSYWYVLALCVLFYSVIFPFRSTFSIKYFQHAHGLPLDAAGVMNSYVFFTAIFVTPIFGWIADRFGRRALLMAFGAVLLPTSFLILGATQLDLWVTTAMVGISFSLVPAVLWPSVPYLVEPRRLGTAFGLMTMLQNIGMTVCNLIVGGLNDAAGASTANPEGYTPMLWFFGLLSLLGFVFAWLLRKRETGASGHGLEKALLVQRAGA